MRQLAVFAFVLVFVVCAAPVAAFDKDKAEPKDPDAPKAREIDTKGLKLPTKRGGIGEGVKIASADDLKKEISDEDAQKAILKQVNLQKEFLVLFTWSGSGGDKLSIGTVKDGEVKFELKRGLTRDLRNHSRVFALPKNSKYSIGK